MQRIRLSHGITRSDTDCNSLPTWKCLAPYEMPSGYPRPLLRTGKYDTRGMGDPSSSSMSPEGQGKSPKASERVLDASV